MKKRIRLFIWVTVFSMVFVPAMATETQEEDTKDIQRIITKEEAQANMPPDDPIRFDKSRIEELLTLSPAVIDSMGIVEKDLVKIGIPQNIANSLVNAKFNRNMVNPYLKSIGSTKTAPVVLLPRAAGQCSCNKYTLTTGITVDGVPNQMFHTSVSTSSTSISNYVTKARGIGRYLFGYPSLNNNTQYINTSYFLFGEHVCGVGLHEGIDLRYTNNEHESFRTIVDGEVKAVNMGPGGFGTLTIRHPTATRNIMFLHAYSYDSSVQVGTVLNGTSFIGYQGGRKGTDPKAFTPHVHIEARDTSRLGPADDQDNSLGSYAPYDYLWPSVPSSYR